MKKWFLLWMAATAITVSAQAKKIFEPSVNVYYATGEKDYIKSAYGLNAVAGFRVCPAVRLGVGIGLEQSNMLYYDSYMERGYYLTYMDHDTSFENATLLPIFGEVKTNFTVGKISPYALLDAGSSTTLKSAEDSPGFFFRPAFGVDFQVGNGKLFVEAAYRSQHMSYQYYYISSRFPSYNEKKSKSVNLLEIRVGYSF